MLVADSVDTAGDLAVQYVAAEDEVQNILLSTNYPLSLHASSSSVSATDFQSTSLLPLENVACSKGAETSNCDVPLNGTVSGFDVVAHSSEHLEGRSSKDARSLTASNTGCSGPFSVSLNNLNGFIRCGICDKAFTASDYSEHVKGCLLEKPLKCERCGEEYNKEENLVVHHIIEHSEVVVVEGERHICPLCLKVFNRASAYYGHLNQHYIKETVSCSYCSEEFEYLGLLDRHVRTSHLSGEEHCFNSSQICTRCGILVPNKVDMEKHMSAHRKISKAMKCAKRRGDKAPRPHKCTMCEKSFAKFYELTRHSVVHTKDKKFKCDHCGRKFSQKSSMRQHMKSHLLGEFAAYKCELCEASFSQAGNLRRHISSLHPINVSSRVAFRCPHCTCVFNSIQPLQVHMGKRHSGKSGSAAFDSTNEPTVSAINEPQKTSTKQWLTCCWMCGKAFLKPDELIIHYRVHRDTNSSKLSTARHTQMQQQSAVTNTHTLSRDVNGNAGSIADFATTSGSELINDVEISQRCRVSTCPASFPNSQSLTEHFNTHSCVKSVCNGICAKTPSTSASSGSSEICATGISGFHTLKCWVCSDVFKNRVEFKEHFQKQHCGSSVAAYDDVLVEEFSENEDIIEHSINDNGVVLKHSVEVSKNIEDAAFISSDSHLPFSAEKSASIATCSVCYNTFSSCSAIFEHLSAVSSDSNHRYASINCSYCSSHFTSCQAFYEHIRIVHCRTKRKNKVGCVPYSSGYASTSCSRKVHQCEVCGRAFTKPCDLTRHRRIHTGEKPFKCDVCGRHFRVKSTLYQHMKVHKDCRDDCRCICSVCSRTYSSNSALKLHLKMAHIEERSYKCLIPNCDFRFVTQRQRDVHVRRFHIEHKGEQHQQGLSGMEAVDIQFASTVLQLTPSLKNSRTIEQSKTSAFSRIDQSSYDRPTHIALKIRPSIDRGQVEIHYSSLCGVPTDNDSIVIELSVLRPLVSDRLLLKVQIATNFLPSDAFVAIDARRLFKLLENRQTDVVSVPLNAETDMTNLPFAVFATICGTTTNRLTNFVASCAICDETFESAEQSVAHFRSEDHETAQLFASSNTTAHAVNQQFAIEASHHYQSSPLKSAPTDISKLGSFTFDNGNWLDHTVRDDLELLVRPNMQIRRRTLD